MVRLRSDRWYSRSGQGRVRQLQRPAGGGIRRVFSLAVLLILVVWVMQRSAEPEAYERIFRYLGVPFDSSRSQGEGARAFRSNEAVPVRTVPAKSVTAETKTSNANAEGVSNTESPVQQSTQVEKLTQLPQFVASEWDNLAWSAKDLHNACQLAFDLDAPQSASPGTAQEALIQAIGNLKWSQPDVELAVQIGLTEHPKEFSNWLDQKLLSQLTDGSPWRSSESDVFYRLLQKAHQWNRAGADKLSVMSYPALKESLSLQRGKEWIRFRGWIEQAKQIPIKERKLGFDSYWTLWIRPSDQTARPVVAYVTRLPSELDGKTEDDLRGEIEVFGLPAKVMAYNSMAGVEVAPTLCGIASDYFEKESSIESEKKVSDSPNFDWIWPVVLAGFFAAAWIAWIWQSSKTVVVEGEEAPKSDSKKLKFVLGAAKKTERDGPSASSLFLAMILSCAISSHVCASPSPWMAQDDSIESQTDEEIGKAVQLLASRLNDEALFEIRHYAANEPTGLNLFPNSLGRLMYTVGQLGADRLSSLVSRNEPNSKWTVRNWEGWVNECSIVTLNEQQAEWMGQKQVFRLQVEIGDGQAASAKSVLFLSQAPSQWLNQSKLRQPFRATVVDLTDHELSQVSKDSSDSNKDQFQSLFGNIGVANSVQWTLRAVADIQQMQPEISNDWQRLATLGSDLTWIDLARSRQKLDLAVADRNSFYQLLKIASKFDDNEGPQSADAVAWTRIQGPELLATREQDKWIGRAVAVKGRISRITRVPIENKTSQQLSGSTFYYEMDGFIRIEGKRIVIPPANSGNNSEASGGRTEDLVYENEFPMTVVAIELPDFLKAGEFDSQGVQHQSWDTQRWVDVKGIFYRNWSYRSEYVSRGNSKERQMAPLIAAVNIQITEMTSESVSSPGNWVNWLAMFVIFGLIALIWGFVVADSKKKGTNRHKKNKTS